MKSLSINMSGIIFGLVLLSGQLFSQNILKNVPQWVSYENKSSEQNWSMELRAKRTSSTQSTINNFYLVDPSNVWCKFAIAYDHGENYFSIPNRTYTFTYSILRNGNVISSFTEDVPGDIINEYVAYHEFSSAIQIYSNNVISGRLNIAYRDLQLPGGGYTFGNILPDQLTPNSIVLSINPSNVTISTIVQPMCPDIVPPNYYHHVEATNSITLNPGFVIDADDMDFYAEAINGFSGSKNVGTTPDAMEESVFKTRNEKKADEEFIRLYPNPSDGKFTVKNIKSDEITVSFYSQMGKLIPDEKLYPGEEKEVNLSQINARFITLLINSNGKFVSRNTMIINK